MVDVLKWLFRLMLRTYEWLRGWKHRPLSSIPPSQVLGMIANRARSRRGAWFRALYLLAAALRKFRERLLLDRVNFSATLRPPLDAVTLRRVLQWEYAVLEKRPAVPRPHLNIRVHDAENVQLDRLMSVLLLSEALGSINIFFDDSALAAARSSSSTLREEGVDRAAFDLNAGDVIDVRDLSSVALSRTFSPSMGFDGNVNSYLKVAHPGALVVALSLPESEEGFCDDSLPAWLDALERFESPVPNLSLVILNAFSLDAPRPSMAKSVSFARMAGLSFAESLRLAQLADVFVGPLDVFGAAALAARRPGVYSGTATGAAGPSTSQIFAEDLRPAQACDYLKRVLAEVVRNPRESISLVSKSLVTGTAGASAAGGAKYTLVIPTYNRPELLARLLQYLEREEAAFPIMVLDSSGTDALTRNKLTISAAHLDVRHVLFDQTLDPYAKLREGLREVATPYCSICADDDVLIVPAVQQAVTELERRPDFGIAHGYYFNFVETESFDLSYVMYRGKSIEDAQPLSRLRTLFAAYEAVFYGVFRTEVARFAFRDVDEISAVLGKELLTASLSVIAGKALRIPCFYYGRNTAESLPYSDWHPHQILAYDPEKLFSEFPVFRALLAQAVGTVDAAFLNANTNKIIDLVFLRYLEAFLRHNVLDLMLDMSMSGKESSAIYQTTWDVFVRPGRAVRATERLLDRRGRFNPERFGASRRQDYYATGVALGGKERRYRIFHEFLFPQMQPSPFAGPDMLDSLLRKLNGY